MILYIIEKSKSNIGKSQNYIVPKIFIFWNDGPPNATTCFIFKAK